MSRQDSVDKVLICERGDLVFVFNFHPTNSYTDYRVGCKLPGEYKVGLGWYYILYFLCLDQNVYEQVDVGICVMIRVKLLLCLHLCLLPASMNMLLL